MDDGPPPPSCSPSYLPLPLVAALEDQAIMLAQLEWLRTNSVGAIHSKIVKREHTLYNALFSGQTTPEVHLHAVYAFVYVGLTLDEVSKIYAKPKTSIQHWVTAFDRDQDSSLFVPQKRKKTRKFTPIHDDWLKAFLEAKPLSYLREIRSAFDLVCFQSNFIFKLQFPPHCFLLQAFPSSSISTSTIYHAIRHLGYSHKKIEQRALQVHEDKIATFTLEINTLRPLPLQLIFLDESSIDSWDMQRDKGWFIKGSIPCIRDNFQRTSCISLLSFLSVYGLTHSFTTDGTWTRKKFGEKVWEFALSCCQPYPGRFSVWVMDNAVIHCHLLLVEYLLSLGIYIFYLPPYCPFYNPIEVYFHLLKQKCCSLNDGKTSPHFILGTVLEHYSNLDMSSIFSHCGYSENGLFNPLKNYLRKNNKQKQ